METKEVTVHTLQTDSFDLSKTTKKIKISEVFTIHRPGDINGIYLFIAHFNTIPNYYKEININCNKANQWFVETYKKEILDVYFNKRYFNRNPNAEYEDIFYFLFEDLIVHFDRNQSEVRILFRRTSISIVDEIVIGIKKFKGISKRQSKISLLVNTSSGIGMTTLDISKPKLQLSDNYNEDILGIHQIILKRLSKKNDKGLVLLHGKPGTGKTSYIRFLITQLKKKVIFLPPNMASALTKPDLISTLIDNPNSIFVIEDAENIVMDREQDGNSPVSALLNISDGLLSDCLNIQIICSFNTDVSKIDNALLRKGRLIARYDFKELEVDKANMLSKKLGFNSIFIAPMPLAAIYNQEENEFKQAEKPNAIGFQTRSLG